jgi:hypothetical protein
MAWLFIAVATIDGAYRFSLDWPAWPVEASAMDLARVALSVVGAAGEVLLPAAILLGCRGLGRAGSWLLQGATALAAAELVAFFGHRLLATGVGPDANGGGLFGVPDYITGSMALQVPVVILEIFGLTRIGLALRVLAGPSRPQRRILFAAPAAALAVLLLADLLTIQVSEIAPATAGDAISLAYSLLLLVIGAIVLVLWAWIASLAFRQHGRAWRWIAIGAGAIALASVVDAIGWTVVLQRQNPADIPTIPVWFGFAASLARTTGAVSLVLGFGRGFDPVTAEAESASDGAPGAGANIGPLDV